ncbi:rab2a [Anaeramoeba flamelloides]|uniref:Rab2a n=1 Tax=Anaeramoeba flamelloides TaxID=1746091 RepID=A0ABQ8ZAS0_9EUKA|nr:rab2a [Anaeramoeba flamelloides]
MSDLIYIFKVIFVGDMAVGKSSILSRFIDNKCEEKFRAVTRSYYRETVCVFLVYDVTRRETFNSLQGWLNDAREYSHPNAIITLIGNKIDMGTREVTQNEGVKFSQKHGLNYFETSAKDGINIEKSCSDTIGYIYQRVQDGDFDDYVKKQKLELSESFLNQDLDIYENGENEEKKSSKCC